jgi:hypothetical protein
MSTLLTELVRRQTSAAIVGLFSRTVDKMVESMAEDLLRDPDVRDQLRAIVKEAFAHALKELKEDAPPEDERRRRSLTGL